MILLIDDIRDDGYANIVARNFQAGCSILRVLGDCIDELYIDFDLGKNQVHLMVKIY